MPTKTVRIEHAELCDGCTDLLRVGTTVIVDEGGRVTCLSCAPDRIDGVVGFVRTDPWCWIDDRDLHDHLHQRNTARPLAISA